MTRSQRRPSLDDLSRRVDDLVDQLKVLVAAVDDLRCEVEWRCREAAQESAWQGTATPQAASEPAAVEHSPDNGASAGCPADGERDSGDTLGSRGSAAADVSTEAATAEASASAAERLASRERSLTSGECGPWPDECEDSECPEFPVGAVIAVDEDSWLVVLELRPAHVVGHDCCCEDGIGAPYLLAWRREAGCFLRELSDDEAVDLQRACLAAQAEREAQRPAALTPQTQLDLW